ncbi:unnamed protein product [Rotaria magnacalcarata]|uniref:Iodothyronine deiodinase n=2 Tax=Rotaria magnacalcarata TaxID=392030 RepID=A0A819SZZ7_9BILA|nr:unnamed protein product [Rotaria magnacalcarata]CAF3980592.1 unnamed protein product [Rotaria magnacalcarata]CAF4056779.1 unnamed protein product [Rotaria magnacalcarata]CAF4070672.1 unnamed protein product [Rotaria magnacalcarata]CAF4150077.1 unnamed protein product [Rotaria magnacalcarata]
MKRRATSPKRKLEESLNTSQQYRSALTEAIKAAIHAEQSPSVGDNKSAKQYPVPPQLPYPNRHPSSDAHIRMPMTIRCRMLFPSSGHTGFDTIKISSEMPPLETVREMILYETRLRLSGPIQELMDLYHTDEDSVTFIHDVIQQHVVEHFGYRDVNALRTAVHRFPDDPIVKEAFYSDALFRSYTPKGMRFLVIYIAEAHARDQWPVGNTISSVNQPTVLDERLENARRSQMNLKFEMPMLVDNMDNSFHETYGSWPFRFYAIYDGKLVMKPEPDKDIYTYNLNELDRWVTNFYV